MRKAVARWGVHRPRPLRVSLPPPTGRVFHSTIRYFVRALAEQGVLVQPQPVGRKVGYALAKPGLRLPARLRRRNGPIIMPMMGPSFGLLYTAALAGDVVPFCWDVWQPQWEMWARHLRRLRPPVVFVTAEQSARFLAHELPESRVVHIPEATRLSLHDPGRPLAARSIGVLELGRRHQKWHDAVCDAIMSPPGHRHLYESRPGQVVFPHEPDLYRAFSNTVISVCFPRSITHPHVAGEVETTTQRYFESMASGCLVLGHAPKELVRLMGYNPVVEVDWTAPAEQVLDILNAPHRWQSHVDEALRRVREVGDWSLRVPEIKARIEATVTEQQLR